MKCLYAKCCYTECRYAVFGGALIFANISLLTG
jgi:hypothetical protein